MLAVRRGGVDSVRQLVASMFLMETQVADVVGMVIVMVMVVLVIVMVMVIMMMVVLVAVMTMIVTIVLRPGQCLVFLCDHSGNLAEVSK